MTGDLLGEDGCAIVETLEVWRRDPVECIRELIGNPLFRDAMAYAPERVYLDGEKKQRCYDEMWTADWWWDKQVSMDRELYIFTATYKYCIVERDA